MPDLAVINCCQIVTMGGPAGPRTGDDMHDVGAVDDAGMLIGDGKVVLVAPNEVIKRLITPNMSVVDADGQVMLPGFVDAHTHLVFGGNRADEFSMRASGATYEEIAGRGGGILSTVAKTRAATEDELVAIGIRRATDFLAQGTTTIEAKSGYGLTLEDELKILRAISRVGDETLLTLEPTFLGAHALPPEFKNDPEGYVNLIIEEMLPAVADEDLAKWCDIFVEQNYFDADQARRIMSTATDLGLGLRMHADQLRDGGGALLAAELGAKTADHLEHTPSEALPALREAGVMPVLLPASVFCLGKSRYPDARGMIDRDLAIVLATDFNPGSSPTCSISFVMSLAMTQMRMSAGEALTAVTINAAHSLDLGDRVGSLEPSKYADFSLWPVDDWLEIPYWVASLRPSATFVAGELTATGSNGAS